jgi:hypothetical protein
MLRRYWSALVDKWESQAPEAGSRPPSSHDRVIPATAPTGVAATDTANLKAVIAAIPFPEATQGGTILLQRGQYIIDDVLKLEAGFTFVGAGKAATELRVIRGNLFAPSVSVPHVVFEKLTLSTTSDHLFEFGSTGGLNESIFRDVLMVSYSDAASLMHLDGSGDFLENVFENCEFNRQETCAVPAFDLSGPAGGINANTWQNCRAQSHNCATSPFWRLEATLGTYLHDNRWTNIVGELNRGGLIHLYSPNGARFDNVVDWDATGTYVDHIVQVTTSPTPGGTAPRGIAARNVGTRFGVLEPGVMSFSCPVQPGTAVFLENIGDPSAPASIPYIWGATYRDAWGVSASFRSVVESLTLDGILDGVVAFAGPSLTATLPPLTAEGVYPGRRFTIKNTHPTSLTVDAAEAASVDGGRSARIPQWAAKTFISDGDRWLSI